MPKSPTDLRQLQSLIEVVSQLRGPDGCPWDKEQTHSSLTQYAIEEIFEFVEALETQDDKKIKEELGDVLFQVVLHAQLASERKAFDFFDVLQTLNEKLIRRHPHVFSNEKVQCTQDVINNWEKIKSHEKLQKLSEQTTVLNVPSGMPSLQRAYKIGKRTEKLKFDWENPQQVWNKVTEEYNELEEALELKSAAEIEHEIGDVLFSVAQLARHLNFEPEQVLRKANLRFEKRFDKMLQIIASEAKSFEQLSLSDKESFWQKAKISLKKQL